MNILKILGVAVGASVAGFGALAMFNPGGVAETSIDSKDESLRTRRYKIDLKTFVAEAEKTILTVSTYGKNWKLVSADAAENSVVVKAEVPVVVFTDDLKITANYDAETGETTVDVRSASRLGNSDLGENRRHILQILKILDERSENLN